MRIVRTIPLCALFLAPALHADATIRYKATFKLGAMFPPSVLQQAAVSPAALQAITSTIQIKGDKEITSTSQREIISDPTTQQVTVVDLTKMQYATISAAEYKTDLTGAMPSMQGIPPQAKMMLQGMKVSFISQKTGKTDVVMGVPVSESVWTMTLLLPATALPLPGIASTDGYISVAKIVANVWIAGPEAVAKNAALKEVVAHRASTLSSLYNPDALLKLLGDFPQLRDSLGPLISHYVDHPPMELKLDAQLYLPIMAQLAPLMQAQGAKAQGDPSAALGEIAVTADEISSALIDPSAFQVPAGYAAVPVQQMLQTLTNSSHTAANTPSSIHAAPATNAAPSGENATPAPNAPPAPKRAPFVYTNQ